MSLCATLVHTVQFILRTLFSPSSALALVGFCLLLLSLPDEDYNPGWGDCGRPLWLLPGFFLFCR